MTPVDFNETAQGCTKIAHIQGLEKDHHFRPNKSSLVLVHPEVPLFKVRGEIRKVRREIRKEREKIRFAAHAQQCG